MRLPDHQSPDHLDQSPAHRRVPTAVDRAFFAPTITEMNPRTQPRVAGDLPPIAEALPAFHLVFEHRRAVGTHSLGAASQELALRSASATAFPRLERSISSFASPPVVPSSSP